MSIRIWLTSFCALATLRQSLQQPTQPPSILQTQVPGIQVQINRNSDNVKDILPVDSESPEEIIILTAAVENNTATDRPIVNDEKPSDMKSIAGGVIFSDLAPTLPPFDVNPTYPPPPPPTLAPFIPYSRNPPPPPPPTIHDSSNHPPPPPPFPLTPESSTDYDNSEDSESSTDQAITTVDNVEDTLEVKVIDLSNKTDIFDKLIKDIIGDLDFNTTDYPIILVDPVPTRQDAKADEETLPVIPVEAVLVPNQSSNTEDLPKSSTQDVAPPLSGGNASVPIESAKPSGQFFCFAQCLAFCINSDLTEHTRCSEYCNDYENQLRCDPSDIQCWKRCNSAFSNPSYAPQSTPQISGASYIDNPTYTEQFVRIFWEAVPNATLYALEIIPNPSSMVSGAVLIRDITYMNFYNFQKPNLCFEYYVRVSAVNQFGIGQFSQSTFIQSTVTQLPLNFAISDASAQDPTSTITGPSIILDPTTDQILVRLQYVDDFNRFSLDNFDVQTYVLATDCKNPVDDSTFGELQGSNDLSSKVYKIADGTVGTFSDSSLWLYFPKEFVQYDCIYSFRVSAITNTCGKTFNLVHEGQYDSIVGVDFRLNCHTVENSVCVDVVTDNTQQQPNMSPDIFALNQETANADAQTADGASQITCTVDGFAVEINGENKATKKLNVSITWFDDMMSEDSINSMYFMRHGTALRAIPVVIDDVTFDYEDPVPIVKNNEDAFIMTVNMQSVEKDNLHSFQICKVPNGSPFFTDFDWDGANKHVVDFSGYIPDDVAIGNDHNQRIPYVVVSDATSSDTANISWTIVLISLVVAALCFALMILVTVHFLCRNCKRQRRKLAKLQQNEKPVAIIAA